MYTGKLAVAIKSAGKVLREFKDQVYVPFGSEYSILIKNMNSRRALVTVTIDGVDVGDGTEFVVNANESLDLERFIKNGNQVRGNRFTFIERTANIEKHKGVGIEDGLIRVEFSFEKEPVAFNNTTRPWRSDDLYNSLTTGDYIPSPVTIRSVGAKNSILYNQSASFAREEATLSDVDTTFTFTGGDSFTLNAAPQNDVGITVEGSISDQKFTPVRWFPTESESHVIVLKLLGKTEDKKRVTKPVTVKAKPTCKTCGRVNKATAKFCQECGTSLTIV